ncbi:frizzled-9-like [Diadema antillarum]|uniref:frizzled-9-like n=1 Tax=Diadema antillarum TaxID=105358 RepID=UPI003A8C54F7
MKSVDMATLCVLFGVVLLGIFCFGSSFAAGLQHSGSHGHCERITIEFCQGIGYNLTRMPNLFGHLTQSEAAPSIHEFHPLVVVGCAEHLRLFLCSMYAPMCSEHIDVPIPSCQSMCEDVRRKCEPVMTRFSFSWPESMNCDRLPRGKDLCMVAPNTADTGNPLPTKMYDSDIDSGHNGGTNVDEPGSPNNNGQRPTNTTGSQPTCTNPQKFVFVPQTNSCAPRCDVDVYFQQSDKDFTKMWIGVWAILCFVCTAITVLTFLIDRARFRYPERPIIFLSMCYNLYSLAFIVRLIVGPRAIACEKTLSGVPYLIQEGLDSTGCTIIFLTQYYFFMASSIWWVILTLTWFLAAGMKWGYEAIAAYSSYYHVAAWALPAVKSIIALLKRRLDGDELTGMCFIGNHDRDALTYFVLVPLFVYFAIGTLFILAGFFYLFRIRKVMKNGGTNIDKLERLMVRIGIFSVLYTVPATAVIACYFYQRSNMDYWRHLAELTPCRVLPGAEGSEDPQGGGCAPMEFSIPSVPVLSVKLFMLLVVGITSGMWIWSSKTVQSWQKWFSGCALLSPGQKSSLQPSQHHHHHHHHPQQPPLQQANGGTPNKSSRPTTPRVKYPTINGNNRSTGVIYSSVNTGSAIV